MVPLRWHAWLIAFALVLAPLAAEAGSDLDDALKALSGERDPEVRLELIKRLVANDDSRAAAALDRLVRSDPEVRVRAAAARALGRSRAAKVDERLAALVLHGGPLGVRRAVAATLRRRPDAVALLLERMTSRHIGSLDAGLMLEAFGSLRDEKSLILLTQAAALVSSPLAGPAIRALAARSDRSTKRLATFVRLLSKSRDPETLLNLLDAAEPLADPMMRPSVLRLTTFLDPMTREAATRMLGHIDVEIARRKAAAAAPAPKKKDPKDRYADPEEEPGLPGEMVPPDPTPHGRYDLVYLMDATGSAYKLIHQLRTRIRDEVELIRGMGGSARVGLIAFRGHKTRPRRGDILPLTFDVQKVDAWLEDLDTGGVDDRGAHISGALHDALDRMGWRPAAQRRVKLFADTGVDDPKLARSIVSIHFRAERARTSVTYVLRTRTVIPPELGELARAGGTGKLELMR